MSTGKRLAKRSILGTRVACNLEDGKYYPGIICDVKSKEELGGGGGGGVGGGGPSIYSVLVDGERSSRDLRECDLIGSGFTPVNSVKLRAQQRVFITYNNREVSGKVIYHRPNIDEVLIAVVNPETNVEQEVKKRLEEVRLLESRKSARLADQDTDFAKLADCTSERNNRKTSSTIDVPGCLNNGSRKRRGSRPEDDLTDECAAALVLMKLSCSPRSPAMHEGFFTNDCFSGASSASSGFWSWGSRPSSSKSPPEPRSVTPSPPLSDSSPPPPPQVDDVIDLEDSFSEDILPRKRRSSTRVMFKCTWKDCPEMTSSCSAIEQHIRTQHLGLGMNSEPNEDDEGVVQEEEFYWTEIEVNVTTSVDPPLENIPPSSFKSSRPQTITPVHPVGTPTTQLTSSLSNIQFFPPSSKAIHIGHSSPLTLLSSPPTLSHMDMARPPHEDPDYKRHFNSTMLSSSWPRTPSYLSSSHRGGKVRSIGASKAGSGRGKRNGESRKCRKVYGMEQKDQWCTQCKWKKACSRFGE